MPAVKITADQSHAIEKAWLQVLRDYGAVAAFLTREAFEKTLALALERTNTLEDLQQPAYAEYVPWPGSPICVPFSVEVFQLGNVQACRLDLGLLGQFYLRLKGE